MHYYKRNLGDYAKKAGRLSMLQHGAYTLLIDACYDREQFPTATEAVDWTWAASGAEIEAVEFVLRKFFILEDGVFVQKRIQDEIAEYKNKAETNTRIAKEREDKRRALAQGVHESFKEKHEPLKESSKPSPKTDEPTPSQDEAPPERNESPPNHEPRTKNQEPITSIENTNTAQQKKGRIKLAEKPQAVSIAVWQDFVGFREKNRAPLTPTALQGIEREAERAGMSLQEALAMCCARGWKSFNARWIDPKSGDFVSVAATSFAQTDDLAKRKKWEEMTGRQWPKNAALYVGEIINPQRAISP